MAASAMRGALVDESLVILCSPGVPAARCLLVWRRRCAAVSVLHLLRLLTLLPLLRLLRSLPGWRVAARRFAPVVCGLSPVLQSL
jgi:hypothetical protein